MTILRVGSNSQYADGWEQAFGKGTKPVAKSAKATKKAAPSKKKAAPKKKAKK